MADLNLNFSITQLQYVLAVHKHGHFAKASQACNISQPTLSMQIQKLEEINGTVIFDRSKKPILLTEQGKVLVAQMQKVISEAKKLAEIMASKSQSKTQGELLVGIIPTIAPYLLPQLLPIIQTKYPDFTLKIFEMQTHKIVESLRDDEIDVGILAIPLNIPGLHERSLYLEPFYVLSQKSHKLSKHRKIKHSMLEPDDIWLLEEGHCMRNQIMDVCSIKQNRHNKRPFQFESGSLETLKRLVSSYGGYTLLPELAANEIDPNAVLIPFERPIPAREIGMVFSREHYKQGLIQALEDSVKECLPEHISKIKPKDLEVVPID